MRITREDVEYSFFKEHFETFDKNYLIDILQRDFDDMDDDDFDEIQSCYDH